jgi:hypothetical protein
LNNAPNRSSVSLFCSGHSVSSWSIDIVIISGVTYEDLFQSIIVGYQSWSVWIFHSITNLIVMKNGHTWMKSITFMKQLVRYQRKFGFTPVEIEWMVQKCDISRR